MSNNSNALKKICPYIFIFKTENTTLRLFINYTIFVGRGGYLPAKMIEHRIYNGYIYIPTIYVKKLKKKSLGSSVSRFPGS